MDDADGDDAELAPGVDRALGRAWRDPDGRARSFHTRLTELGPRLGGSPGERRAADLVVDAFAAADLGPRIERFELQAWERGEATLTVSGERAGEPVERAFAAPALPYSPPGEIEAELVDVGYGTPEEVAAADLEGKLAVASTTTPPEMGRFVHRMEKYGHAVEAGAAGFLFANHVDGQLPPTGSLRFDAEGAIPGVGVSKETGDWLREYADLGATARLRVEAATEPGESGNVVGSLGPDTDEAVVLLAHYDAHDVAEGALDNGCGIACLVAALPTLRALEPDRRVVVAAVGCEEVGLIGAEDLAARLELDAVRAVVNVDGAGRARDLKAYSHGHDGLAALAERVVEGAGQPLTIEETPHPYSDHWPFLRAGVPALQLHSTSPGEDRGRGWGHTSADTRDKVDYRDVREHAMLAALLVAELSRGDRPDRVEPERLADQLRGADAEAGMRAAGLWPDGWD
jgi:Zn-dependent M28 family amino/carboxypeptidase